MKKTKVIKSFTAIPEADRESISKILWQEVRAHPYSASCNCLLATAIEQLVAAGYLITKEGR